MRNKNLITLVVMAMLPMIATSSHAGSPLWTFTPLTATTISVSNGQTANAQYKVTNQSARSHTLMLMNIKGVTQITTGAGVCGNPFVLSGHDSCILSLQINGSQIQAGNTNGPLVCEQGSTLQCYRPSAADTLTFDINVNTTTTLSASVSNLALSVTGLTEYGVSGTPASGRARTITITNTGSSAAVNLAVTPPAWPAGTTNTTTCGSTLAAGANCTITVTPGSTATSDGASPCSIGTAPVPGVVQVAADNANTVSTNVVVLSYGCIYQGGYVYAFDDTTPATNSIGGKVTQEADNTGAPSGIFWDSNSGCTNAPYNSCYTTSADSGSNGSNLSTPAPGGNTYLIYQVLTTTHALPSTSYAAGLCTGTISGHNDWYLPALCEMGYGANSSGINCGSAGSPTLQNMQSSLVDNGGIGGLTTGGNSSYPGFYWSSTEYSPIPSEFGWYQLFATGGGSSQGAVSKGFYAFGVRCSRAITN